MKSRLISGPKKQLTTQKERTAHAVDMLLEEINLMINTYRGVRPLARQMVPVTADVSPNMKSII